MVPHFKSAGLPSLKETAGHSIPNSPKSNFLAASYDFSGAVGRRHAAVNIPSGEVFPRDDIAIVERYRSNANKHRFRWNGGVRNAVPILGFQVKGSLIGSKNPGIRGHGNRILEKESGLACYAVGLGYAFERRLSGG